MTSIDGGSNGENWVGKEEILGDDDERRVLYAALDSFYQYAKVAHYNTTHVRRQNFYAMPQAHWQMLAAPPISYLDTLNAVDDAIDENAKLSNAIFNSAILTFEDGNDAWQGVATSSDVEKARSTLRQFYRDWSVEGIRERKACFDPIIEDLRRERIHSSQSKLKVLVPGAGLGRLVFELCLDGHNVEGNEISYHQLMASSYVFNETSTANCHIIYPWIHGFSNHLDRAQHFQSVSVPDIHPGSELESRLFAHHQDDSVRAPGTMSMSASDFILLYGDKEYEDVFDAVATCFFVDTAPNPIRYIETVRNCLRSGGIWTNLGPLLWHFENNSPGARRDSNTSTDNTTKQDGDNGIGDPGSVELTDEELVALVEMMGFRMEQRERGLEADYIQDPKSMLQSSYRISHWVARKL